jgi:hypothetical protein
LPKTTIVIGSERPRKTDEELAQLNVPLKEQFAAAAKVRAIKVAAIRKNIVAAAPDTEQLIDDLAELAFRDQENRKRAKERRQEMKERRHDDAYLPAVMTVDDGPPMDVILKRTRDKEAGALVNLEVMYYTEASANALRARKIATTGGAGRAAKFKPLEDETIRLYLAKEWKSVPDAALEITPIIVAMSKRGNGDLVDATTKPLEWIRAYNRAKKSNPS